MKNIIWGLLILALVARFAAAVWWSNRTHSLAEPAGSVAADGVADGPFFFGDSDSYWKLGRALAFGRPYRFDPERNWTVFRMPGYPATLVPLFWLGGEHPPVFWARLENGLFGLATVFLTFALGTYLTQDRRVGALAALGAALDPCLILQSVLVLSEEPYTAATLAQLIVLTAIFRAAGRKNILADSADRAAQTERFFGLGVALGATSALTVYFRPSALDFVPFIAVFYLFWLFLAFLGRLRRKSAKNSMNGEISENRQDRTNFIGLLMVILAAFLAFSLLMAPWWLRNQWVTGRFIATTLQGGASLYDGLSPTATGASDMAFVDRFRSAEAAENIGKPTERDHFEVRLNERMRREAVDWAKSHPDEAFRLAGVKFVRLWNFWPNEPSFRAPLVRLAIFGMFAPVLFFAIFGAIRTFRRGFEYWLLWLPAAYITALHLIFVSSLRYRIPVMPPLMILAAFALMTIFDRFRKK